MGGIGKWLNLGTVGFTMTLTLCVLPAWNATSQALLGFDSESALLFTAAKYAGMIGALLYVGLSCLAVRRRFEKSLVVLSALLQLAGYAALFTGIAAGLPGRGRLVVGALLIGAGSGCAFVLWPRVFSCEPPGVGRRQLLAATALMSAMYLFVNAAATLEALAALTCALAVANAAVLWRCLPVWDVAEPREFVPITSRRNRRLFSTLARYLVCVAVIGYGSGAAQAFVFPGSQARLLDLLSAAAMPLSAIALIVVQEVLKREFRLRNAFLAMLAVEVPCFALLPVLGGWFSLAFAAVCFFSFSVASMLMVEGCVETALARDIDASGVFGVFVAIVYTFLIAGLAVNARILMESEFSNALVVVVGAIYLAAMACLALRVIPDDGRDGASGSGAAAPPAAGMAAPRAGERAGTPAGREAASGARGGRASGGAAPLGELCERLGETYLLSERERDVLELLMRGNSVAKMADVLFLSQNTVKSHCRSLYRKMGVHSRQEIVDMLEEWDGPAR